MRPYTCLSQWAGVEKESKRVHKTWQLSVTSADGEHRPCLRAWGIEPFFVLLSEYAKGLLVQIAYICWRQEEVTETGRQF